MNSISKPKRVALYLRDGLGCVYCGESVEDGANLTLDYLRPDSTAFLFPAPPRSARLLSSRSSSPPLREESGSPFGRYF